MRQKGDGGGEEGGCDAIGHAGDDRASRGGRKVFFSISQKSFACRRARHYRAGLQKEAAIAVLQTRKLALKGWIKMAYKPSNLSVLAYANGFTLWHYLTEDASDEIGSPCYFDKARDMLRVSDMVIINCGDGTGVIVVSNPTAI